MSHFAAKAFLLFSLSLLSAFESHAQQDRDVLQLGTVLRQTIGAGQIRRFRVELEQDQLLQLVVDQGGIDLVVRVYSPRHRLLREFDNPTVPPVPLLSPQDVRNLFSRLLSTGLAFSLQKEPPYSIEKFFAQQILTSLKAMPDELREFAPGGLRHIEEKLVQFNPPRISELPIEYTIQVGKPANSLRLSMDRLNRAAIREAVNAGRSDEALQGLRNLRNNTSRADMIVEILDQISSGHKKQVVIDFLEQAHVLLLGSRRPEDTSHLNALLQIARTFSWYDATRGFQILENSLDEFNDLAAAARTLNGFDNQYYERGELILKDESNAIADLTAQLTETIGLLAVEDFDRAKIDVERIRLREVQVGAYLAIAKIALNPPEPAR